MNNNDIEEDIRILNNLKDKKFNFNSILYITGTVILNKKEQQAIENILADRERLEKENTELRKRPVFYYDNNRNTYVWCCKCTDSNMSLHMFLKNGEIQGYASEHYDKWVENTKEAKQIDVCEFMHKFVKPLINKANKYDRLVERIKEALDFVKTGKDADSKARASCLKNILKLIEEE